MLRLERRSLNLIRKALAVPALNYYDDKYGFDFEEFIEETLELVKEFHVLLGIDFDEVKTQAGQVSKILGVRYDLHELLVSIDEERKRSLVAEITEILKSGRLEPGHAAKLKGKLGFAEGQIFGRVADRL